MVSITVFVHEHDQPNPTIRTVSGHYSLSPACRLPSCQSIMENPSSILHGKGRY